MLIKNKITLTLLLIISIFSVNNIAAQKTDIKTDSARVYRNIEKFSLKRKFTKFLYRLVFRPVATTPIVANQSNNNHFHTIYKNYEGKIIRKIKIITIDPFGYSLTDTLVTSKDFFQRMGDKLHVKTQIFTIRNLLLIKKNKPLDSLKVTESERLIRSQNYIHDVLFTFDTIAANADSVDISIRVLDEWSIIPEGAFSSTHLKLEFNDKNIAGLGHNFDGYYNLNHTNGKQSIYTNYLIPNFRNTYISTTLNYQSDEENHYKTGIDIERPFYSPLARWAGGLLASQQITAGNLTNSENTQMLFTSRLNTIDIWGLNHGRFLKAMQLIKELPG